MKYTIAIALLGLAVTSGLTVTTKFSTNDVNQLYPPLDEVLKEIEKERVDDQNRIKHAEAKQSGAEDEAKEAETLYNASIVEADTKFKAWKKTEADLKMREGEYATNDETRSNEEGDIAGIRKSIQKLVEVGPADGTIGVMPKSKLAAVKMALETFLQTTSHQEPTKHALALLQRGNSKITDIKSSFGQIEAAITKERDTDVVETDKQKSVVKAAQLDYEKAEADRVSKLNDKDEADNRVVIAKEVVQHEKDEYAKAEKIRKEDEALIQEAKKMIKELLTTTQTHEQGPTGSLELVQMERESEALQKLRTKIAEMIKDVDAEEKMQKAALTKAYANYKAKYLAYLKAYKKWKTQVEVHKRTEKTWKDWYSKYHGAEMALAQEIAVSQQERATINSVRQMLKRLESAEADVLGSCPTDKDKAVCGGYGSCKTNQTDPFKKKYCECKKGSGRTGRVCNMCKFGWRMATGKNGLKGFCQQVYTPTVKFLQTDSAQFTVADLNDAVETLAQTGRHRESSGGIEKLLAALEATMDDKEKMMRKERDGNKLKSDEWEKKTHAAKALRDRYHRERVVAYHRMASARKIYKAILVMYKFEHPLRNKERSLLQKLDGLIKTLQEKKGHVKTAAVTTATLKASNTHTPTVVPTGETNSQGQVLTPTPKTA